MEEFSISPDVFEAIEIPITIEILEKIRKTITPNLSWAKAPNTWAISIAGNGININGDFKYVSQLYSALSLCGITNMITI